MIGAAPAIYLLIGVGVWEAFRFLQERYFQKDAPKAAIAMGAVVSGLILVQAANTYHTYFQKRGTAPNTGWTNESEWTELAWALNAQPSDSEMVYLIPGNGGHHSFEYLYLGKAPVHVMPDYTFHPNMTYLPDNVASALAAMENVSMVKVVEWNANTTWIEDDPEPFDFLLSKYGRYLGSDEYAHFRVHNYVISLAHPWTFYEHLEPLTGPLRWRHISPRACLGPGRGATVISAVAQPGTGSFSVDGPAMAGQPPGWISIMRYPCASTMLRAQGSTKRMMCYGNRRTIRLRATGRRMRWSIPCSTLNLPADLPPGDYELLMVVYNFETQVPIVQVGVWEPEALLARLRLAEVK